MTTKYTYDWPTVRHVCTQGIQDVSFTGHCEDGAEVICLKCQKRFVYIKNVIPLHFRSVAATT